MILDLDLDLKIVLRFLLSFKGRRWFEEDEDDLKKMKMKDSKKKRIYQLKIVKYVKIGKMTKLSIMCHAHDGSNGDKMNDVYFRDPFHYKMNTTDTRFVIISF